MNPAHTRLPRLFLRYSYYPSPVRGVDRVVKIIDASYLRSCTTTHGRTLQRPWGMLSQIVLQRARFERLVPRLAPLNLQLQNQLPRKLALATLAEEL